MFKKILSALVLIAFIIALNTPSTLAQDFENPPCDNEVTVEHLKDNKYSKINLVKVTNFSNIVQKENVIEVTFSQNFNSKYYKEGDFVQFDLLEGLSTIEGTCIIPKGSSLIAKIVKIQKPRWFSRNAIVCINFTHILFPDGKNLPIVAKITGKKDYL